MSETLVCVDCTRAAAHRVWRPGSNGQWLAPVCHRHAGFPAIAEQPSEFACVENAKQAIAITAMNPAVGDAARLLRLANDLDAAAERARSVAHGLLAKAGTREGGDA